ncbi:hypothetical protein [Halalkalibacter sp. APA_J-10(15)]|uniref:hypothetical protein n=1 Tax=unclassified Halalkalibacter TaxID=2893063 RepID=UPI001FF5B75B|nr:hypothetical protein [Halalkalibacter sp. APA_J-10(15)]MCK0473757.1 hypothetical protein [Halalkalibacter sp. APA_J-10(15)]
MKLYPIYEFPPSLEELEELIRFIDLSPSLSLEKLRDIASQLYGKRMSRTNILIKDLAKLGLIEGRSVVTLTWEAQLYVDLNRKLDKLLVHNVYKINDLFESCKLICKIDPKITMTNPSLYKEVLKHGYSEENIRTVTEKLYAIKRLIKASQREGVFNPFLEYEQYIDFLSLLKKEYLILVGGYGKNASITSLFEALQKYGYEREDFKRNLDLLYSDPIFATYTSFSTVNIDFAKKDYFLIKDDTFYYIKIKKSF